MSAEQGIVFIYLFVCLFPFVNSIPSWKSKSKWTRLHILEGPPASRRIYLRKGRRWWSDPGWCPAGSYGSALCAPPEMCAVCNSVHNSRTCVVFPLEENNVKDETVNQRAGTIQRNDACGAVKTERPVVLYKQTTFWDHGHSTSSVGIPRNSYQTVKEMWAPR